MFDFILQYNSDQEYFDVPEFDILNGEKNNRFEFNFSFCKLSCITHDSKDSFWFEDDSNAIFLYGKIFRQYNNSRKEKGFVKPEEIFNELLKGSDPLLLYKGNFTIIYISKEAKKIRIINDHFAIKPIYYQSLESSILVSSNLYFHKKITNSINYTVVLERLLFSYPIGDETYVEGAKFLNGGDELVIESNNFIVNSNFNLQTFVFRDKLEKFDINEMVELFNISVKQRASCSENIIASLTGGLDGRAVVSTLLESKKTISTYSFGCKGGENTIIPLEIAGVLPEVNYTPLWLHEEFEKEYVKYGLQAIYQSDGLSTFERANYPYAFKILSEQSKYVLSGLFGGELFGPVNMVADYINPFYYNIFFKDENLSWHEELNSKPYSINSDLIKNSKNELNRKIINKKKHIQALKKGKNGFLYYYYDLLSLGFRRFYGSEVHIERYYVENLTPFLDFDILNYLFSTTYIYTFKNAYKANPFTRRNSKIIQCNTIVSNSEELGSIKVDRNFTPKDLLNPIYRFKIPFMFYFRKVSKIKSNPEFDQKKWNQIFYSYIPKTTNNIFTEFKLVESPDLNIAVSLKLWIEK